jgi:hypothetical protein
MVGFLPCEYVEWTQQEAEGNVPGEEDATLLTTKDYIRRFLFAALLFMHMGALNRVDVSGRNPLGGCACDRPEGECARRA